MHSVLQVRTTVKIGDAHERLTIIGQPFAARINEQRRAMVVCECRCGSICCISPHEFHKNKSCGCYDREAAAARKRTHGQTDHPLYRVHCAMKQRCSLVTSKSYRDYGAKGIRVCDEWQSFEVFHLWAIASGWKSGLEIDRINSDGHYEPANCQFISKRENNAKRDVVQKIEAFGEVKTITEWTNDPRCKVPRSTFVHRLQRRWSVELALSALPGPQSVRRQLEASRSTVRTE